MVVALVMGLELNFNQCSLNIFRTFIHSDILLKAIILDGLLLLNKLLIYNQAAFSLSIYSNLLWRGIFLPLRHHHIAPLKQLLGFIPKQTACCSTGCTNATFMYCTRQVTFHRRNITNVSFALRLSKNHCRYRPKWKSSSHFHLKAKFM